MDFSKLQQYMDDLHRQGVPGGDVLVYKDGQPVYRHIVGYADAENHVPLTAEALYFLYSCTKPITVTAALQLVEQGLLGLDDPVYAYLPAFKNAYVVEDGQTITVGHTMTVRHLFTMSAGLNYDLSAPATMALIRDNPQATTRQVVDTYIEAPLDFRPGERFQYSLCHDVLAAIVEVVSGCRYRDHLQKAIFAPLGMTDIGFEPTPAQEARIVTQYDVHPTTHEVFPINKSIGAFQVTPAYDSGGAGLFASAENYGRFAAAMSCGGVAPDGTRILQAKTVDMMRTSQLDSYVRTDTFGNTAGPGYGYGLGVRTLVSREGGQRSALGEFGWDGAAGSYSLMDPTHRVAIVYTQQVRGWPHRFASMHGPIRDLAYEGLGL